jgi:membrane protein implicated in regulation of membrane protease activity
LTSLPDLAHSRVMMNLLTQSLGLPLPALWLALAFVLAILEIIVPTFVCLCFSAAAVFGMISALCGFDLAYQMVAFGIGILLSLLLLRPRLIARLYAKPALPSRTDALHGKHGQVTQAIEPTLGQGRILVDGQDWAASSSASVSLGTTVVVTGADGIILHVRKEHEDHDRA